MNIVRWVNDCLLRMFIYFTLRVLITQLIKTLSVNFFVAQYYITADKRVDNLWDVNIWSNINKMLKVIAYVNTEIIGFQCTLVT